MFALRGFGDFEVRRVVVASGKDLDSCLMRMEAYGEEEVLASGVRCLINNRMAYGLHALKIGNFSKRKGDRTPTLSDCIPETTDDMENHTPNDGVEPAGRYPYSLDFTKRSIRNQNLVWSLV